MVQVKKTAFFTFLILGVILLLCVVNLLLYGPNVPTMSGDEYKSEQGTNTNNNNEDSTEIRHLKLLRQRLMDTHKSPSNDKVDAEFEKIYGGSGSDSWQGCAQIRCRYTHQNGSTSSTYPASTAAYYNSNNINNYSDNISNYNYNVNEEGEKDLVQCSTLLFDLLLKTHLTLRKHRYSPYLAFGTLLGQHTHNQKIFEWTHDVDIALSSTAFHAIIKSRPVKYDLYRSFGLVLFRNGLRLQRVCLSRRYFQLLDTTESDLQNSHVKDKTYRALGLFLENNIYLDLYEEYRIPSPNASPYQIQRHQRLYRINPSDVPLTRWDIYPLKKCFLHAYPFECPRRSTEFLSRHFGPRWNQVLEV